MKLNYLLSLQETQGGAKLEGELSGNLTPRNVVKEDSEIRQRRRGWGIHNSLSY
jgi:hypothetical protein